MEIQRIDGYADRRFSKTVLCQHGAYLIGGEPYEVEITGAETATVRGRDRAAYEELIVTFRFHAPHVVRFFDADGALLKELPAPEIVTVPLDRIRPSQFYIDEEKLAAVGTFIRSAEDIVIQVIPWEDRFVSLDGHTRLYLAAQRGYPSVNAVVSETDDWIRTFVREAERRGIRQPKDLILLDHARYEVLWNQYCDAVFAGQREEKLERKREDRYETGF